MMTALNMKSRQYEVVLLLPVLLMCWWVFGYLGGLDWSSENKYKFNWHPLAMIIAFMLLLGNGNLEEIKLQYFNSNIVIESPIHR